MLFAEAIRVALEDLGVTVLRVASTGAEAIEATRQLRPDVILLDIGLPDRSGLVVGREILLEWPEAKIVALTALSDRAAVDEAIRLGFRGYLTKDTPVSRFVTAVRSAADGHVVLPHRLMDRGSRTPEEEEVALLADQLTPREHDVLALLVQGANGQAVGAALGISRNTVRTHVQSILTKLQVHSRLEAATFAVRHGLVEVPGSTDPRRAASS
jgi:DNA-binding NarL/FixJ family response regulator